MNLRKRKKGGGSMFDEKRFKAQVVLQGMTIKQVAEELNIDSATLYRKMSGKSDFFRWEIQKLCEILDIKDPASIFFAEELT